MKGIEAESARSMIGGKKRRVSRPERTLSRKGGIRKGAKGKRKLTGGSPLREKTPSRKGL